MSTQKQKAYTAHGEVEYDSVTCSSCGNEIPKQSAKRFVMGDVTDKKDWGILGYEEYDFSKRTIRKGWACEHCLESGPVYFPRWHLTFVDMIVVALVSMIVVTIMGAIL